MTQALSALSVAPFTRAWLNDTKQARVLHVFEGVCNLLAADDRMISLVIPPVGDGPFSIVVPTVNFFNYVTVDMPAIIEQGMVRIDGLEIDTTTARVWEARPPWETLQQSTPQLMTHLPLITSVLSETAPAESFARFVVSLPETGLLIEEKILQAAQVSIEKIVSGLQNADFALCAEGASGLVGLGAGFTPDGDDFLLGCVLAAWIKLSHRAAETFALCISDAASGRTTSLSTAWLDAAARGECASIWHLLLESLLGGEEDAILRSVKGISEQGHTSGASALAGFLTIIADGDYHPSLL